MPPQVNDGDDYGDGNVNVLPDNLDANEFENFANWDTFDFNTRTLNEILCHIANDNPLPENLEIEKHNDSRVANGIFANAISNNVINFHHRPNHK